MRQTAASAPTVWSIAGWNALLRKRHCKPHTKSRAREPPMARKRTRERCESVVKACDANDVVCGRHLQLCLDVLREKSHACGGRKFVLLCLELLCRAHRVKRHHNCYTAAPPTPHTATQEPSPRCAAVCALFLAAVVCCSPFSASGALVEDTIDDSIALVLASMVDVMLDATAAAAALSSGCSAAAAAAALSPSLIRVRVCLSE